MTSKNYLVACILVIIAYISPYPAFLLVREGIFSQGSLLFGLIVSICALCAMIGLPFLAIKFYFKKKVEDYGFNFPSSPKHPAVLISLITLIFFTVFLLAKTPSFQNYYLIRHTIDGWFFVEIIVSFFYFISEEFFFRGFLFFGLLDKFGKHGYWMSSLVFAIFHIGKPGLEVPFAFLAGLILNKISFETKSFLPAALIHFFIALALNIVILFTH